MMDVTEGAWLQGHPGKHSFSESRIYIQTAVRAGWVSCPAPTELCFPTGSNTCGIRDFDL